MPTKTRKEISARAGTTKLRIVADHVNARISMYVGTTEIMRLAAAGITNLVPATLAGVSPGIVKIPDATTYTVLTADNGKTHYVPDLTASCTIALPAKADGLSYEFVYAGVAADAQNFILDAADAAPFLGGVMFCDHDAADAEIAPVAGNGTTNALFTCIKPAPGTRVKVECDGTSWFMSGFVNADTVPTFGNT